MCGPPWCAVGEPGFRGKNYRGERKFPLIIQNVHRYFLYLAILFIALLTWDAIKAFNFNGQFGIGLGHGVATSRLQLRPLPQLPGDLMAAVNAMRLGVQLLHGCLNLNVPLGPRARWTIEPGIVA